MTPLMTDIENLLEAHGIRPTAVRMLIARQLAAASSPISSLDIERLLDTVDRSSISRALSLFLERELTHAVYDGTGAVKYELCRGKHSHSQADMHVHFHCTGCGNTYCLEESPAVTPPLPDGFLPRSTNIVVTGLCDICSGRHYG